MRKRITLLTIISFLLFTVFNAAPATALTVFKTSEAMIENSLKKINSERSAHRGKKLVLSQSLSKVASSWAVNMSQKSKLYHNDKMPDQVPSHWISVGENVAYAKGYGSNADNVIHNGYMNSPGHRANILNKSYNYVGLAFYTDSKGTTWSVQIFGEYKTSPDEKRAVAKIKGFSKSSLTLKKNTTVTWSNLEFSHNAVLQQKKNNKWVTVRKLSKNTKTLRIKGPTKNGSSLTYRIRIPSTSKIKGINTSSVTLKVPKVKSSIKNFKGKKTVSRSKKAVWKKVRLSHSGLLQRKVNSRWVTVKKLRKGTQTVSFKPKRVTKGDSYRIIIKKTGTRTQSVRTVKVFVKK